MRNKITILVFLVISNLAYGTHLDLLEGRDNELCQKIFDLRLSNITDTFSKSIEYIADENGIPNWGDGRLLINPKYREKSSSFDIDNDGVNESVSSFYTWLSGHPGEYYRVLDEEQLKDKIKMTKKEIYLLPGLYSNTPWPYENLGLYFFSIFPFKFNEIYYLGLEDNKFGEREFMDRRFLIVKYRNEMFNFGREGWGVTSKLKIICNFSYIN